MSRHPMKYVEPLNTRHSRVAEAIADGVVLIAALLAGLILASSALAAVLIIVR
jgi:hypothetical protein